MSVPEATRAAMRAKLWRQANELGWVTLSPADKSRQYEAWTRDPEIGLRLVRYVGAEQVRVYIKDTLLKDYTRTRLASHVRPFRVLGISATAYIVQSYAKPHGRRLEDGRVICWGRADAWKTILMALHERTYGDSHSHPHAAVLLYSLGRFHEQDARALVDDAAAKLGIEKIVWLE